MLLIIFILVRLRVNFLFIEVLLVDIVFFFLKMVGSFVKFLRVVCGLGCLFILKFLGFDNLNNEKEIFINFIFNYNR